MKSYGKEVISKNIVINSIKIILAAVAAILIAYELELEFAMSAGIVAILTIQPTKKETIRVAMGRLCAFLAALIIANGSFCIFGYTVVAFFIYLIFYISVCQIFSWNSAMAMNSVLISHFVTLGSMSLSSLSNEALIFVIGVGCGIIANLHLRKKTGYIEKLKDETDGQIIKILSRMSERILNKDISDYNGQCFTVLRKQIREAKNAAEENFNNQFGSQDKYDMEYIAMRDRQCQVLYEMYKSIRKMDTSPHTAGAISEFLKNMAEVFERGNDGKQLMDEFTKMDMYMKSQPLPVTRKEFEDRARLFCLMRSIEEFIQIKMEFAEKYA